MNPIYDSNYLRAKTNLDVHFQDVDDLISFWLLCGPAKKGPSPERCDPWFRDII